MGGPRLPFFHCYEKEYYLIRCTLSVFFGTFHECLRANGVGRAQGA